MLSIIIPIIMKLLIVMLVSVLSDEMCWIDYGTNSEYFWDSLQSADSYSFEPGSNLIKFNIGKDIDDTCGGQSAAAILYSKAGDSCEILGRQDLMYFSTFNTLSLSGISVYYEGGSLCRDSAWGDIKRKVQFKLICSETESDFYLVNDVTECTTIFEKFTDSGCPKEIKYSLWVKIIFIG